MDRLACINVAALPLQILLRDHPTWAHLPAVVVEEDRPSGLVLYLNAQAHRFGVRSGQRYATALALARNLQAGAVPASQVEDTVHALTERLRKYSPHVEPAAGEPGVFWTDVQGLDRLYPSLHAWADAVCAEFHSAGMKASVVVGFTRFGVYALALAHQKVRGGTLVCEDAAEEEALVAKVPLDRLHLDPEARDRLLMLGVTTVGDFLHLPSKGIRTRFGAAIEEMHRLAMGDRWAPLCPEPAEEPHARLIEFDEPESNTERLIFVIKRLLDGLATELVHQAKAAAEVSLEMKLQDRTARTESVRPATPTLDVPQLLQLIYLRLGALQLSAGIVTLRVAVDACAANSDQRRLFLEHSRDVAAANQALARVRAECGERAVVRARICDAHSPAARFAWEPLAHAALEPAHAAPRVKAMRSLVRRIYARPLDLPKNILENFVEEKIGPYVLSGGWWAGGVYRDYYFVHTRDGHIWWMYYDHRRERYFLQGEVE